MNKKLIGLGIGAASALAGAELILHGYLDVMYKETIPQGIFKRVMLKVYPGSDEFHSYTRESCEWINEQYHENIDLKSKRGYTVKGFLLMNPNPSNTFVVFAHGYRSTHLGDPANFERFYFDQGYNFLSVDHVAAGESGGNFVGFDYFESDDLLSWVEYLVDRFGSDIKIILHGVSMGGATVCQCASRVCDNVKLIVSDCAYTGAKQEFAAVVESVGIKKSTPALVKVFNGINKAFAGFDLEDTDVLDSVKNSRVPMLFVHGGNDKFVPTRMVYDLYDACENEKDIMIVPNAAHAMSIMIDNEGYKKKLVEFIAKYL